MDDYYFYLIPKELIQLISYYWNYTESVIIRDIFAIEVNYQYLLSIKYPGFYEIVKTIKSNNITVAAKGLYRHHQR